MVETDIRITVGDLYDYNLRHSYSQAATLLATAVGLAGIAIGIYSRENMQYWILMVIVGVLLVFYTPFVLLLRSSQTVALNSAMKESFHYVFDENGITVSQGDKSETHPWDSVVKAVSTGRSIIIYTSRVSATVLPRKQVGEAMPLLIQTISTYIDPKKNKIRN